VIYPKEAGKNFRVGPGVVIGRNGDFPTFGDNVYVASNSTVIGNIKIGDNVIIGAGSVVTKDLPGNGVYVGNPARLIKHIDSNEDLLNEIM
jgi:serine O-acetyltransferase